RHPPAATPTLLPYTTLFRSSADAKRLPGPEGGDGAAVVAQIAAEVEVADREPGLDGEPAPFPGEPHGQDEAEQQQCVPAARRARSEEHTSELQSRGHLVCRL